MSSSRKEDLEPRRLELPLDPIDGSLQTVPLSQVILATTDALYNDLYNMSQGEVNVTVAREDGNTGEAADQKQDRLSSLSFAQRRHEISWRLAQHYSRVENVAALTATQGLGDVTSISSQALQWTRSGNTHADVAQDALFFDVHAKLFPARAAPHDVYGAADVLLEGKWYDMWARDVEILSKSTPHNDPVAVREAWTRAVRKKLALGELGENRKEGSEWMWKTKLCGGVVRLTNNVGDRESNIEALVTVVPVEKPAWKLLSLNITVKAKTGEFQYHLDTSNKQQFNLHRIASIAMGREELKARSATEESNGEKASLSRPLRALFIISQRFSLSLQLELLSAQAQGLRRGVWAAGAHNPLQVMPAQFYDHEEDDDVLGTVAITFWKVDTAYGSPRVSFLNGEAASTPMDKDQLPDAQTQLVLAIQASQTHGIKVALSGGENILSSTHPRVKATIDDLVEAASNPLTVSASDALLAATRLCAEEKCRATAEAIIASKTLPSWIAIEHDSAGISVGASVGYLTREGHEPSSTNMPVLFRFVCDVRTGAFTVSFPRDMTLLRCLVGQSVQASEFLAARIAKLPPNRRKAAGSNSTGRCLSTSFDALTRCMNVLGNRVAVGGPWTDLTPQSQQLRDRVILSACTDLRVAITKTCALAALFGLIPMALSTGAGLNAIPDL